VEADELDRKPVRLKQNWGKDEAIFCPCNSPTRETMSGKASNLKKVLVGISWQIYAFKMSGNYTSSFDWIS
jgi:hypothetical protein